MVQVLAVVLVLLLQALLAVVQALAVVLVPLLQAPAVLVDPVVQVHLVPEIGPN